MRVLPWLMVVLCLAPVAFVGYALLGRFVLHGEVRAGALAESVERASGSAGTLLDSGRACAGTARPRVWRCSVLDAEGSGEVEYEVRVRRRSSCWDAVARGRAGFGMPDRTSGCVHRWQWSLL